MMRPLISVVIPLYNVEPYLRECLDSVCGQTYQNLEILLVDDGSTDKSGDICEEYAAKDSRIRIIRQPNGGVAAARNRGLHAVTGDLIAWVDSDDVCAPEMVQYLYEGLVGHDADMVQCGVTRSPEVFKAAKGRRSGRSPVVLAPGRAVFEGFAASAIAHNLTGKLYKAPLFDGVVFPRLSLGEDSCMQFVLSNKMQRAALLPDIRYYYRITPGSLTQSARLEDCLLFNQGVMQVLEAGGVNIPPYAAGQITYAFAHITAMCLAASGLEEKEKAGWGQALAHIRQSKALMLDCPLIGPLGRLEIRAICTGRPWSWKIAALCQKLYQLNTQRREKAHARHSARL